MANKTMENPTKQVYLEYDELKTKLEEAIASTLNKEDVHLDDEFFEEANHLIVEKIKDVSVERSLLLEESTQFENKMKGKERAEFRFTSSYEKSSSLSMTSSKGYSIGIGGNLGAGYVGESAGVSAGFHYNRQRGGSEGEGRTSSKELCLSGSIKPRHVVIVKELVYEVREVAEYKLVLTVSDETKINYKSGSKPGSVEMKKLVEKLKTSNAIENIGKTVKINFKDNLMLRRNEYAHEVYTQKVPERNAR